MLAAALAGTCAAMVVMMVMVMMMVVIMVMMLVMMMLVHKKVLLRVVFLYIIEKQGLSVKSFIFLKEPPVGLAAERRIEYNVTNYADPSGEERRFFHA